MTSERWHQVEELYHAALERDPTQRAAFLAQADPELCREVESLLAQETGTILNQPAWKGAESLLESSVRRLSSGAELGPYRIEALIGAGGMGEVYRARDTRLGREVAIKLIRRRFDESADGPQRLLQEARAVSALNHTNIVALYDICAAEGNEFLVMELVRGKTLDQIIGNRGIAVNKALQYAIPIADALARAHSAGVLHRDLKPSNIIINDEGVPKILDFGLAKLARAKPGSGSSSTAVPESSNTEQRAIAGTAAYMSPEQAEGKKLDARSDIFSFGAVLYEMVTGQRAFRGETAMSTISSILREEPKPVSQMAADIPRDLEKIISRCLRKDRERRFQHMADVRVALLELKEESESGKLLSAEVPRRSSQRYWLWAGLGSAVLTALIILAFRLRPAAPEGEPHIVPFTSFAGYQGYPTFSPDGNQIAFAWTGDRGATTHVYVKVIGTDTPLRLTSGDMADVAPAWAPDGKSIAFIRRLSQATNGIYQVSPLGGFERSIAEIGASSTIPGLRAIGGPSLSWSGDGKWLFTSGREAPGMPTRIFAIGADTGQAHALSFGDTGNETWPAISPDSRALAFSRQLSHLGIALFTVDMNKATQSRGSPRQLNTPLGINGEATWTSDGKDLIFVNNSGTGSRLWRVPIHGNVPAKQFAIAGDGVSFPSVAPDGHRLVFVRHLIDTNVWRLPIAGPGRTGEPSLLVASARHDVARPQAFSPDGQKIAFESDRSGTYGIWIASADGSNPTFLFGGAGYLSGSPAWSPDGRWIAFDTRKDKVTQIYIISSEGGAAHRLTHDSADSFVPLWSRDGKWIYFDSSRTGRPEIFKISSSGGTAVQVTHNGGWGPEESPEGKFLYYSRNESANSPLLRTPVAGGSEVQILPTVVQRCWAVSDQGIWFSSNGADHVDLRFFDFKTGKATVAAQLGKWYPAEAALVLSPDQRRLLYTKIDNETNEILLVENFR